MVADEARELMMDENKIHDLMKEAHDTIREAALLGFNYAILQGGLWEVVGSNLNYRQRIAKQNLIFEGYIFDTPNLFGNNDNAIYVSWQP